MIPNASYQCLAQLPFRNSLSSILVVSYSSVSSESLNRTLFSLRLGTKENYLKLNLERFLDKRASIRTANIENRDQLKTYLV